MNNEWKFYVLALTFVAVVMMISALLGDWLYPVKAVQSGHHESLFIVLGLVLGFTMRAHPDEDSISALICAIGMAIIALLVGGLDITVPGTIAVGFILTVSFFTSMMGTVVFLLRALRTRIRLQRDAAGSERE